MIKNNKESSHEDLIDIADDKGFLDSNFIFQFYQDGELETDESKSTIIKNQAELLFFIETVITE